MNDKDMSIDALHSEFNQIMGMLATKGTTEEQSKLAHVRLSEISDAMIAISKTGDVPVYVINLLPKRWSVARSYARFSIAPKEKEYEYSVTEISGKKAFIDTGRGGTSRSDGPGWRVKLDGLYYSARQIADDVCKEVNGDLPPLQSVQVNAGQRIQKTMGVFVSTTKTPSPESLAANKALLNVFAAAMVEEGNFLWRKTHDYRQVSDISREFADYLSVSTEWHQNLSLREFCDGCGAELRNGVAKCMVCGGVKNWELALKMGMLTNDQRKWYEQQLKTA